LIQLLERYNTNLTTVGFNGSIDSIEIPHQVLDISHSTATHNILCSEYLVESLDGILATIEVYNMGMRVVDVVTQRCHTQFMTI
jgi:hypothetical protein